MQNIQISYAYGDASSAQQSADVVFKNSKHLSRSEIQQRFSQKMINKTYFITERFGLPSLQAHACDARGNTDWHELISISETTETPTDPRDISEILL
jgi:hypothetical protein